MSEQNWDSLVTKIDKRIQSSTNVDRDKLLLIAKKIYNNIQAVSNNRYVQEYWVANMEYISILNQCGIYRFINGRITGEGIGASLTNALFIKCQFNNMVFYGGQLRGVTFSECIVEEHLGFDKCDMRYVNITSSVIDRLSITSGNWKGLYLVHSTFPRGLTLRDIPVPPMSNDLEINGCNFTFYHNRRSADDNVSRPYTWSKFGKFIPAGHAIRYGDDILYCVYTFPKLKIGHKGDVVDSNQATDPVRGWYQWHDFAQLIVHNQRERYIEIGVAIDTVPIMDELAMLKHIVDSHFNLEEDEE